MDIEWPFLGRDELVRRVTSAITEGPGGAVLQGPLGIGKTRLSQTVVKGLAARGWHVERCIGSPAGPGIPFGAIWHMASTVAAEDLAHELEKLRGRLLERAGSSPLVLVVDDANLVDTSSMALFLRLARFGDAAVLMTRRTGEPGNDEAITSLWKDGMAALFDVGPLDRETQDALVMHVLGTVEAAARAERLWQLSEGNPLFLRELLGIVIEGGADDLLTGGPYDLSGKGQWTRLAAIVSSRTRRLGNDERDALDVVAVAEPVPTELLKALASAKALASLEAARHGDGG